MPIRHKSDLARKAEALDEIAMMLAHHLDGSVDRDELITKIAHTIENRTNYIFVKLDEVHRPAFKMTAHERLV